MSSMEPIIGWLVMQRTQLGKPLCPSKKRLPHPLFWGGAAADYGVHGSFSFFWLALPTIMGIMGIWARFARGLALFTTKLTKGAKHIGPAYRAVLIMVKDRKARNRRDCAATCNRNVFRRLRAAA